MDIFWKQKLKSEVTKLMQCLLFITFIEIRRMFCKPRGLDCESTTAGDLESNKVDTLHQIVISNRTGCEKY